MSDLVIIVATVAGVLALGVAGTAAAQSQSGGLEWDVPMDWDNSTDEIGVVHDDVGDRNASWVRLGYAPDGDDPLVYYPLDEDSGSTSSDASGNSRDGTVNGPTLGREGILGTSGYSFGGGDTVLDDDAENYLNGLENVTFSAWVRSNETGVDKGVFDTKDPDGQDNRPTVRYDVDGVNTGNNNLIKYAVTETNGNQIQEESVSDTQTTAWQHLVLTWQSGGDLKLYVNGTVKDGGNSDEPVTTVSGVEKLLIGQGTKFNEGTGGGWNGSIDEFRAYDETFPESEVKRLFRGAPPRGSAVWNGTLLTDTRDAGKKLDPTTLNLSNVGADVPEGTNVTARVRSDSNDDGTFEEVSGPVALDSTNTTYEVPQGSLSTLSSTYRLSLQMNTSEVGESPRLDRIEITGTAVTEYRDCIDRRDLGRGQEPQECPFDRDISRGGSRQELDRSTGRGGGGTHRDSATARRDRSRGEGRNGR